MSEWIADFTIEIRNGTPHYVCECGYEATGLSELAVHDTRRHG